MGRMFTATVDQIAVTALQDLFEIVAASDAGVTLHALIIGQSSDPGDAEAEMLPILIHRGTATGSGGASVTSNPVAPPVGDAFGGTVERNNTTQSVETDPLHADAFNAQVGYQYVWTPETRPSAPPSGILIVELPVAPADSLTVSATLYFEEG